MNVPQQGLRFAIRLYQIFISPLLVAVLGPFARCRFNPSCSEYARQAIAEHGAVRGTWLAAGRLCRCHPWGASGEDPPPPARLKLRGS